MTTSGFFVAYRRGTADESVIDHSFANDIFLSGMPEYTPSPTDIVVDVGAHIGTLSLLLSRKISAGQIYAIEASRDSYNFLRINIALNSCDNVAAFHMALADRTGECTLFHDRGNWGHSMVSRLSNSYEQVACCTLASFIEQKSLAMVDFIKFNCEGAEFPILLSTDSSVLGRIRNMLVLYHCDLWKDNSVADLLTHLQSAGFRCTVRNQSEQRGWIIAVKGAPCGTIISPSN